jgi:error-prone DNA polymerase
MTEHRYAEMHTHSNFSFLDGASHPEALVERAAELGYEALAVTDHDGFYGLVRFWQAARRSGLPAVYGVELSLCPPDHAPGGDEGLISPFDRAGRHDALRWEAGKQAGRKYRTRTSARFEPDHLVVLASSPEGYARLAHLVSRAQLRGAKGRPLYLWNDLAEAAGQGNLVALSGCWQGAVPRAARQGDREAALREASRLREVFGQRFHIEIWNHRMPQDDRRNDLLWEVAARLNLPVVATNNVHYADRRDADLSDVLAAIGGRRPLTEHNGFRPDTDERHLKSPAEMAARFRTYPGAVERAAHLGRELAFDLRLVAPRLPDFPLPDGFATEMDYLRRLTFRGARKAYPASGRTGEIDPKAVDRLEHELDVIERLGFPGYFLVVWDIVNFARSQDIMCQIRGSGADSAVCRCLGLTRVDPLRLGLPFERFLSDERGRPPDIDLDLESERREEVIQYCYRRYGRERAAMVANVITYRARSVLKDVAKAFGFTQAQADGMTRYVDTHAPTELPLEDPLPAGLTAELVYGICRRLDGFPRHLSIHSGGMVIADRPLWQVVPVEWGRMENRTVLQWDKDDCAAMGIVKFDLLGLGMLNALHLTVDTIEDAHGDRIDLATVPQEPAVYEMLTRADTVGLFQVESRAQMATLPRLKPRTFYDLAVQVALIRPGPIQGASVHPYLRRRNGKEPVRYPHPLARPVLERTLGVPVFQEQLMELARVCAGFDGAQSDRLRSAMTHKRSDEAMAQLEEEVFEGMRSKGVTGAAAREIWEKLQGFASFGFPESHSMSFAYIVYMSAWLRYHYPAEFLVGLLNAQPMGFYSPNSLVQDALRHGVVVLDPDVNRSLEECTVEPHACAEDDIVEHCGMRWRRGRGPVEDPIREPVAARLGLGYVRNLGEAEARRLLAARQIGGAFSDPTEFAHRTGLAVDTLEGLAAAGAFGSFGISPRQGIWMAGALAGTGPERLPLVPGLDPPRLAPMKDREVHQASLWATGVSVKHPMHFARPRLAELGCIPVAEALEMCRNGVRIEVGGVVTHRQRPATSRGIVFFNLEDETGLLNVVVLPEIWMEHRRVARRNPGLIIRGILEYRDGVTNLVARGFTPLPTDRLQARNFR